MKIQNVFYYVFSWEFMVYVRAVTSLKRTPMPKSWWWPKWLISKTVNSQLLCTAVWLTPLKTNLANRCVFHLISVKILKIKNLNVQPW